MSKIRNLMLVALLVLCVVPIFSACKDDSSIIDINTHVWVQSVEFDNESKSIALPKDSTEGYELKYTIEPSNATNKKVEFSSSNPNVATVYKDDDGKVKVKAVGAGTCYITIKSLDNKSVETASATVTVTNAREKLDSPTNLSYDGTNLTWNPVTSKNSKYFAPTYELSIKRNGDENNIQTITTTAPLYEKLSNGDYEISVRALGDDKQVVYENSDSTTISFTKLGMPTNLQITADGNIEGDTARSYMISFELAENSSSISDYEYKITPVSGNLQISATQQEVWDQIIQSGTVEDVDGKKVAQIPIAQDKIALLDNSPVNITFASKSDITKKVYGSGYTNNTEVIQVGKLKAPSNLILSSKNDGSGIKQTLTWGNVSNAYQYKLKVVYKKDAEVVGESTYEIFDASGVLSYDMSSLLATLPSEANAYEVYLYALGATTATALFMDSEVSSCAKQQLSNVQNLTVEPGEASNYYIRWDKVTNADEYKVYISNNKLPEITDTDQKALYNTTNNYYSFGFDDTKTDGKTPIWNIGDNYIKVVAVANPNSSYVDSVVSVSTSNLTKLATPELKVSYGVLTWTPIAKAEEYIVEFSSGNGGTKTLTMKCDQTSEDNKLYSYEPTSGDFSNSSSCDVKIYAKNSGENYIKSQTYQTSLTMFGQIDTSCIKFVNGNMSWEDGLSDSAGNAISTNKVEVEIAQKEGGKLLATKKITGSTLSVADELANFGQVQLFSFRLRAISGKETGSNEINGGWSKSISTYQLKAPTNLRVENGVLTWNAIKDDKVGETNSDIRYVIKRNNVELQSLNLEMSDTSTVLDDLSSNQSYEISIQTKILNSSTTIGDESVYIINSSFSAPLTVKLMPTPTNLTIDDNTLSWKSSNASKYKIYMYKEGLSVAVEEEIITPASTSAPTYDFSLQNRDSGKYSFVVQAIGNDKDLTSYVSDSLSIYKLPVPTITVSDQGELTWTNSYSKLGSTDDLINVFSLSVSKAVVGGYETSTQRLSTTTTDLSFLDDSWCGSGVPLTFTIQALNGGRDRVYDSDASTYVLNTATEAKDNETSKVTVYKLPKLNIDTISINETDKTIEWTSEEFANYGSGTCKFYVSVYQKSSTGADQVLIDKQAVNAVEGKGSIGIKSNWTGQDYYIRIQQAGFATTTTSDDSSANITRRMTSEYSDSKYFTRFGEAIGINLSSDNGAPVLNWKSVNDSANQRYCVTLEKFDDKHQISRTTTLTYYVPYDADNSGLYSLNLYDVKGLNSENQYVTLQEMITSTNTNLYGEYQMYITVVPVLGPDNKPLTSITKEGNNYLLVPSNSTYKQTMTIYTAPSIALDGGNIIINDPNGSSKGINVILKFQEVALDGNTYSVVSGSTIKEVTWNSTSAYTPNVSDFRPGTYYQVTTQAIGNGSNFVTSPEVISNIVLTKLDELEPNTVSVDATTASSNADGWYVKDGLVCWRKVEGASGYNIYMTRNNTSKLVRELDSGSETYSTALSYSNDLYGQFTLQFQVKGGGIVSTESSIGGRKASIGYLSSDVSSAVYVNKLFAPNGTYYNNDIDWKVYTPTGTFTQVTINRQGAYARIDSNGEFDFGIRDKESGEWTDVAGVSKYVLNIKASEKTETQIEYDLSTQSASQFKASEYFLSSPNNTYVISMYSIGADWFGGNEPIYLKSDAINPFEIRYSGVIDSLGVANGQITWSNSDSTVTYSNYELKYQVPEDTSTTEYSVELSTNQFGFEDAEYEALKNKIIDQIYVRYRGSSTSENAYYGYVNSGWNSTPLTRVMKLPNIEKTQMTENKVDLYIDDYGQLAWSVGEELENLQKANGSFNFNIGYNVKTRVTSNGTEINKVVLTKTDELVELNNKTYAVPSVTSTESINNSYVYDITAFVQGSGYGTSVWASDSRKNNENANILFLNGSEYTFTAGKLNTPADDTFRLDEETGSVRVTWDLDGCDITVETQDGGVKTSKADKILLTYSLNGYTQVYRKIINAKDFMFASSESAEESTKGGTAFWELGIFNNLKLSVLNGDGSAFGSEAIPLYKYTDVTFKCFASGTGTRNDPFVITDATQLANMFWLPEKYFKLGNDIKLDDLSTVQKTYANATSNILYPAEFYQSNPSTARQEYINRNFTGGFDGNNKTISNYQVTSSSMSIWNMLDGSDVEKLTVNGETYDDTIYHDKQGIITRLTVEVNTIDVSKLKSSYNGIIVAQNRGLIYDCHITGDNNKTNDEGNRLPVIEGTFEVPTIEGTSTPEYYIGGIAGLVADNQNLCNVLNPETAQQVVLYEQVYIGRIEKCTNLLDLEITSSANTKISVGGIVGLVQNGYVVDCVNGSSTANAELHNSGKINGFNTGGIAGSSIGKSYEIYNENDESKHSPQTYYSYIYGCKNFAKINTISTSADSRSSAGGIVGLMSSAYVTYCINYGTITTDGRTASLGGISGTANLGAYISNTLSAGKITYKTAYTTEITRDVYAGTLCGDIWITLVLYNSAYNTNSIVCDTTTSHQIYDSKVENANSKVASSNLKSYADLEAVTLATLENDALINNTSITVNYNTITTSFANIDSNYPKFKLVEKDTTSTTGETEYEWTIEWVTASDNTQTSTTE